MQFAFSHGANFLSTSEEDALDGKSETFNWLLRCNAYAYEAAVAAELN